MFRCPDCGRGLSRAAALLLSLLVLRVAGVLWDVVTYTQYAQYVTPCTGALGYWCHDAEGARAFPQIPASMLR
jgi:hypothetical protein